MAEVMREIDSSLTQIKGKKKCLIKEQKNIEEVRTKMATIQKVLDEFGFGFAEMLEHE